MSLSWEKFVQTHATAVLDSALRVVANPTDAEDVAQEVFLEILRKGNMHELRDQPALLRTMATRRALDLLRKNRVHVSNAIDVGDIQSHEPIEYAMAEELDLFFRNELAKLPNREAEVFCLTFFEGLPSAEIASLLNISIGAVAKSLCAARKRLSLAFDKKGARIQP